MLMERMMIVRVRDGLHARPATQLVKLAKGFQSAIEIIRDGQGANAKSSVKLMLLGVKEDDEILLRAEGEDAADAIDQLAAFISSPEAGLDVALAPPPAEPAPPVVQPEKNAGIPASEGMAIGPVFAFFPEQIIETPRAIPAEDRDAEVAHLRQCVNAMTTSLAERKTAASIDAEDAAIIDALIGVARDDDFNDDIETRIRDGLDAVTSVLRAGKALATSFEAVADPYIRARAEDVRNVTRYLALALTGRSEISLASMSPGSVVVADELGAFDLARADLSQIAGILCRKGTPTSHVAIMARSHGIPAIVGADISTDRLKAARMIAIDGKTGAIHLDPDGAIRTSFEAGIAGEAEARAALAAYRDIEPVTKSGRKVEVAANLGSLKEIDAARAAGAMGVGLFRTEFLFMEKKGLPSEDEQASVYTKLAEAFRPYPVVVRTLDIGGDKPVAGVEFPHEDNPFLGWRGVRMCLDRPDVFKPQLKALLRAAVVGNVKVMVPMIDEVEEVRAVRRLIAECKAELDAANILHADFDLGIMMETPAAALLAEELAPEVAFFSIGTNDLTQYIMAADRMNARVAHLNRTEHPAVMKAIGLIAAAAAKAGIWVGMCGEAAARPDLIPAFLAMGITELSMSPSSIARAKKCVLEAD